MTAKALLEQQGIYEIELTPEELREKIEQAVLNCCWHKARALQQVDEYLKELERKSE